jgi:hypothetical protein
MGLRQCVYKRKANDFSQQMRSEIPSRHDCQLVLIQRAQAEIQGVFVGRDTIKTQRITHLKQQSTKLKIVPKIYSELQSDHCSKRYQSAGRCTTLTEKEIYQVP